MKHSKIFFTFFIIVISSQAQTLNNSLKQLEPFLDKTWSGKLTSPDGSRELTIERNYKIVLDGSVVKITKVNRDLNNFGEGYFYWNDIKKQIAFFFIESKGIFSEGYVTVKDNTIILEGTMTWQKQTNPGIKQSYNFRNTFEFTPDGKMIDTWNQNAFGDWRQGHEIIYEAIP
jgi:hypothetical protein